MEHVDPQTQTETLTAGPVQGRDALRAAIAALLRQAKREVRLYAPRLDAAIFDHSAVTGALVAFATRHAQHRANLLVEDAAILQGNQRLLAIARRLADTVELREADPEDRGAADLYLIIDRSAHLMQQDVTRNEAVVVLQTPRETAHLIGRFGGTWDRAQRLPLQPTGL